MNDHALSDRMPAVARGEAEWTIQEAEHLRGCAECRGEFTVVQAGIGAGAGVAVDGDRIAAAVLKRLRTEPRATRPGRRLWVVVLAAAAVVALILVPRSTTRTTPEATVSAPIAVQLPGIDGLSEAGLSEVLESLDPVWTDTPTIDAPNLEDLDPQELEQVQRSWEI